MDVGWRHDDLGRLALACGGILATVGWARWTSFLTLTPDSRDYWAGGALLADGGLGISLLDVKRGLSQQSLHAVGFTLGIEGLQAMGAVLLLFGAVLLALQSPRRPGSAVLTTLALASTALLSPQFRTMAAYLNGHMLVAVLLLVLVLLIGAGVKGEQRAGLLPAVAAVSTALVITRPEGAILVGLVLLGTLGVSDDRAPWRSAWAALAVGTITWTVMLAAGATTRDGGLPPAIVLLGAVGASAALVALALHHVPARVRRLVPTGVGTALWAVALLLERRDSVVFFDVANANLGGGAGGWGVFGPLLIISGVVAVRLTAGQDDLRTGPSRWFVIGFIPITMLVKLGDGFQRDRADLGSILSGGGRIGWGDSVNRMWMHAALVVLLLVIRSGERVPLRPRSTASAASRSMYGVVLLAIAGGTALQRQPDGVPRSTVEEEFTLLSALGDQPIGELVDGAQVNQRLALPPPVLPSGTISRLLCADVRMVTFARGNVGDVELELRAGGRSAFRQVAADPLVDWGTERVCLDLSVDRQPGAQALGDAVVAVTGRGAVLGVAASALQAPASASRPGALLVTVDTAGVTTEHQTGHLVMDVVMVADVRIGLLSDPLRRSTLVLPWLALLIGIGLAAAAAEETRRARADALPG